MSVFAGVLWREWREHRAAFTWAPVTVLGLMLFAALSFALLGDHVETEISVSKQTELHEKLGERAEQASALESLAAVTLDAAGSTDEELRNRLQLLQTAVAQPFRGVFLVVAFFVLLGCVYDERKDRSVLFWKSMPVSDLQSIAGKAVFVLWIAPLITIVCTLVAQFGAVALSSMYVEPGMGGRIWQLSDVWLNPLHVTLRFGLYGIWALPLAGWIVLVSASVNRLPALWAVGVPATLIMVERMVLGGSMLADAIKQHLSVLDDWGRSFDGWAGQLAVLGEPNVWAGVVLGLLFLAAAVYMRRARNEI